MRCTVFSRLYFLQYQPWTFHSVTSCCVTLVGIVPYGALKGQFCRVIFEKKSSLGVRTKFHSLAILSCGCVPPWLARRNPGTVTIPQYRLNKTKQHTHCPGHLLEEVRRGARMSDASSGSGRILNSATIQLA